MRKKKNKRIVMLRPNRELQSKKEFDIPEELNQVRADALVEHGYAKWIEVAVAHKSSVERATAAHVG